MTAHTRVEGPVQVTYLDKVEIVTNHKLKLPEKLHKTFNPEQNPDYRIWWNNYHGPENKPIVISDLPLSRKEYDCKFTPTEIYDTQGVTRVRPPKDLLTDTDLEFQEGTELYYLAYNDMLEKPNPAVFLVSDDLFDRVGFTSLHDDDHPPEFVYPELV